MAQFYRVNGRKYLTEYITETSEFTFTSPAGKTSSVMTDNQGRVIRSSVTGVEYPYRAEYDGQGRLVKMIWGPETDPEGISREYLVDYIPVDLPNKPKGYVDRITDPYGTFVEFEYNAAGRVTKQIYSDGRQISYVSDSSGNIRSITTPNNDQHGFTYTDIGQTSSYEAPIEDDEPNITTYSYNSDRQLTRATQPGMLNVDFHYDQTSGRLEKVEVPWVDNLDYSYYDNGENHPGMLKTISTGVSVHNFEYNGTLLAKEHIESLIGNYELEYHYDNFFNISSFRLRQKNYQFGFGIEYDYDNDLLFNGFNVSFPSGQGKYFSVVRNEQNGLIETTSLVNITTDMSYNGFGELASMATTHPTHGVLLGFDYEIQGEFRRDKLGRITKVRETLPSNLELEKEYFYDDAGRLQKVCHGSNQKTHYEYDNNGNRTRMITCIAATTPCETTTPCDGQHFEDVVDFEYDAQDRLERSTNNDGLTTTYYYKYNGELRQKTSSEGVTEYYYDVLGNLRKVTLPNSQGTIEYLIDGRGRRVAKGKNRTLVQGFLYIDQLNPVAELDENLDLVSVFYYGTRLNVPDAIVSKKLDGETWRRYRVVSDHLGSVRMVVDVETGTIAQRMDYDEFGNVLNDSNEGFQPFGFAGGLYDPDTGLVRFGARDYDQEIGRWTSKDPIGFDGDGSNLYGYSGNDSINFIDPFGYFKLPSSPSGLGQNWTLDPSHRNPSGGRYRHPDGDFLDFHKGKPGRPGWGGKDHWHRNGGKEHLPPGTEVPDPEAEECNDSTDFDMLEWSPYRRSVDFSIAPIPQESSSISWGTVAIVVGGVIVIIVVASGQGWALAPAAGLL
jgi:RHS repeat-associated protein